MCPYIGVFLDSTCECKCILKNYINTKINKMIAYNELAVVF